MPNWQKITFISVAWLAYVAIGYFITRDQFFTLFGAFALAFGAYLMLLSKASEFSFRQVILLAVLFRVSLWMTFPQLSDDVFRFIWDGRLALQGENPFLFLPVESLDHPAVVNAGLVESIYPHLNSKIYYTIYPPVDQLMFLISAWVGNGSIFGEVISLRVMILAADIGALIIGSKLLESMGRGSFWLMGYALNPLVVVELTGNLHGEGIVIFFMLLALWYWKKGKNLLSAVFFGLAVSTKLLPLLFLPLIWRALGLQQGLKYCVIVGLTVTLSFLPFASMELLENIWSSIDLYFQSFEFNASIYYLAREVGMLMTGENLVRYIGPVCSLIVVSIAVWMTFRKKSVPIMTSALWLLAAYLFLSTTIHPWYLITVLFLGMLAQKLWVIPWSLLCLLSYSHYIGGGYEENYLLIGIEYALVILCIYLFERPHILRRLIPSRILNYNQPKH